MKKIEFVRVKLVKEAPLFSPAKLNTPEKVVEFAATELSEYAQEIVAMIAVSSQLEVINISICSIGTINAALISPREIFQTALLSNATGIILLHNHPSGNPDPSRNDCDITKMLKQAGDIMRIPLLDHIIVGNEQFYSFKQQGYIDCIEELDIFKNQLETQEPFPEEDGPEL